MAEKSFGIHWFRRDLRIYGNPGLQQQWKRHQGRVVGLFCFDQTFLSRSDFSHNRFQFFLETLKSLKLDLQSQGSDLLIVDSKILETLKELTSYFSQLNFEISWCRDYENYARARDEQVEDFLNQQKVAFFNCRDHLIIEPEELEKPDGGVYKVYTPFSRKWLELFQTDTVQQRIKIQRKALELRHLHQKTSEHEPIFKLSWPELFKEENNPRPNILRDSLDKFIELNSQKTELKSLPAAGEHAAFDCLNRFKPSLDAYGEKRDFPVHSIESSSFESHPIEAKRATSGLSPYLKNGSITTSQIIAELDLKPYSKKSSGRDIFLRELIWREFYYHTLYHFPEAETKNFTRSFDNLRWRNNQEEFELWKQGKTGYPIVDAGMRELNQTGFMHNRVRMIVASFLTKHLLIDWRWGERYFMEKLLDGDIAANNGGWQWAASTGCDAQPYFRIFNPWIQSKKFDPEARYIKHYVTEIQELAPAKIHSPILDHPIYPKPIVEHAQARDRALKEFKACRD